MNNAKLFDYIYNQYQLVHLDGEDAVINVNKWGSQEYEIIGSPFMLDSEYYVFMKHETLVPSLPVEYVRECLKQMIADVKPTRKWGMGSSNSNPDADIIINTLKNLADMLELDLGV